MLLEWEILGTEFWKGKGSAVDAKIVLIKGLQEVLVSLGATFSYIRLEKHKIFLSKSSSCQEILKVLHLHYTH